MHGEFELSESSTVSNVQTCDAQTGRTPCFDQMSGRTSRNALFKRGQIRIQNRDVVHRATVASLKF